MGDSGRIQREFRVLQVAVTVLHGLSRELQWFFKDVQRFYNELQGETKMHFKAL